MADQRWRRLSRNSTALLVGRFAGQLFGFLFTVLLARLLGAAGLGAFTYLSAIVFVGNVATTFGLDTLLIRSAAQNRAKFGQLIQVALQLELILLGLFLLMAALLQPLLLARTEAAPLAYWFYLLALLPLAFGTIYSAILRGRERMELYLLYTLTGQLLMLLGAALLSLSPYRLPLIVLFVTLAHGAAAWVGWRLCRRIAPGVGLNARLALDWRALLALAGRAWPLALLATLALIYQRLGIFSLTWYRDDTAVGYFSAALRLLDGAKALPYAVFGALFPQMSHLASLGKARWTGRYQQLFGSLVVLTLLSAGLLTLLAPWLLNILIGPEYRPAAPALQIMGWSLPLFLMTLRLSFDLVTAGADRPALWAIAVTLLTTAPLTLWLTRWNGLMGAAWGLLLGELIQVLVLVALVRLWPANRPQPKV